MIPSNNNNNLNYHHPKRKIFIIGCGLAGLCVALCLKRVSEKKNLNLDIQIFEATDPRDSSFIESHHSHAHLLWKWVIDILQELGFSKRLSKIMKPIKKFRSFDTETNQILVEYPPLPANMLSASVSSASSIAASTFSMTASSLQRRFTLSRRPSFQPKSTTTATGGNLTSSLSRSKSTIVKPASKNGKHQDDNSVIDLELGRTSSDSNSSFNNNKDSIKKKTCSNNNQDEDDHHTDSPMYAIRHQDLLRLFTLALSGLIDEELTNEPLSKHMANTFLNKNTINNNNQDRKSTQNNPANNSDAVYFDAVQGLDADLAREDWFRAQGILGHIPELNIGYQLESFTISASTGLVNVTFTNGHIEEADMIIGADGVHSQVRNLIFNDRCPPQNAGAAIFSGIVRLHMPPVDMPTELENGVLIPDMTREDLLHHCPDGNSVVYSGRGFSFGTTHLGNGMMSWNLVVPQSEPKEHINNYILEKEREKMSKAIAKNHRQSFIPTPDFSAALANALSQAESDVTPSKSSLSSSHAQSVNIGQIMTPPPSTATSTPDFYKQLKTTLPNLPDGHDFKSPSNNTTEGIHRQHDETMSTTNSTNIIATTGFESQAFHGSNSEEQRIHQPLMSSTTEKLSSSPSTYHQVIESKHSTAINMNMNMASPKTMTPLPSFATLQELEKASLSGTALRDLCLRLVQNIAIPPFALAIIARTEPEWMDANDSLDLAEEVPESYTCSEFHPGRVMIIGDAAHPIAINAHGNVGAGLAITDAAYLAKLIGKYLDPISKESDEHAFTCLASDFIQERLNLCNTIMREARSEGGWDRAESGLVRSLMRLSVKYVPATWKATSFESMLTRGAVPSEESLTPLYPHIS